MMMIKVKKLILLCLLSFAASTVHAAESGSVFVCIKNAGVGSFSPDAQVSVFANAEGIANDQTAFGPSTTVDPDGTFQIEFTGLLAGVPGQGRYVFEISLTDASGTITFTSPEPLTFQQANTTYFVSEEGVTTLDPTNQNYAAYIDVTNTAPEQLLISSCEPNPDDAPHAIDLVWTNPNPEPDDFGQMDLLIASADNPSYELVSSHAYGEIIATASNLTPSTAYFFIVRHYDIYGAFTDSPSAPCSTGEDVDSDGDGVLDGDDNCASIPNSDQLDSDVDGVGDACDNCPEDGNSEQSDLDGDGVGDACDNCQSQVNESQTDTDLDGVGDVCDNCPDDSNLDQSDTDADTIGDICDNCDLTINQDQADIDSDGVGDACDNCELVGNTDQTDGDGDGIGDACDNCDAVTNVDQADGDADGIGDTCDNCAGISNSDQADGDGNGIGDACQDEDSDGYTILTDCDDSNASVNPGATENCGDGVDNDCLNGDLPCDDVDLDGDGYTTNQGDCDDTLDTVNPDGVEICADGIDQNCSGQADEGFDSDGDGALNPMTCASGDDCDDADAANYPNNTELCDGQDNNCDSVIDEGYEDLDGDNLADCVDTDADGDTFPVEDDCDDLNAISYPGADEICDGQDQDCDTDIDEGFDVDSDTHWNQEACGAIGGDDCDDQNNQVYTGATELCDGTDNNCDGAIDEGFDDLDGDGQADCVDDDADGDGYTAIEDCNDLDTSINPGVTEVCDGIDQDCDGVPDNGFDEDGDGHLVTDCSGLDGDDCDDTNDGVHGGATEICNGIDDNCDGIVDEGFDEDGDGFSTCDDPSDCDDSNADVNPDGTEECGNGIDEDCDTSNDACEATPGNAEEISSIGGSGFACSVDGSPASSPEGAWMMLGMLSLALSLIRRRR